MPIYVEADHKCSLVFRQEPVLVDAHYIYTRDTVLRMTAVGSDAPVLPVSERERLEHVPVTVFSTGAAISEQACLLPTRLC